MEEEAIFIYCLADSIVTACPLSDHPRSFSCLISRSRLVRRLHRIPSTVWQIMFFELPVHLKNPSQQKVNCG